MNVHDPLCPSETHGLLCSCALIRMVRANERGAIGMREIAAELRTLTDLRAKVEALHPDWLGTPIDVLALIDGGSPS